MYSQAFRTFRENYQLFIAVAALFAALDVFWPSRSNNVQLSVLLITSGYVAFYSHRMVLLGPLKKAQSNPMPQRFGRFGLVFLAFCGGAFGLAIGLAIMIAPMLAPYGPWQGQQQALAAFMLATPPTLALLGVALALIGGVMPAIAINADASLRAAFKRGRKRVWITLLRLAVGGLPVSVLSSAIPIALGMVTQGQIFGTIVGSVSVLFVDCLVFFFAVHLIAVALSLGYLEAGGPVPNGGAGETPAAPSTAA